MLRAVEGLEPNEKKQLGRISIANEQTKIETSNHLEQKQTQQWVQLSLLKFCVFSH